MTRWPVMSGVDGLWRCAAGRRSRTAQRCIMVSSTSPWLFTRRAMTSVRLYSPSGASQASVPCTSGGTITRWATRGVSGTVPRIVPPLTRPSAAAGVNAQRRWRSRGIAVTPRSIKLPEASASASNGRWMPSKMLPISPGPSSTLRGEPVPCTGSPGRTPEVSSYTWMVAMSPRRPITSPMSRLSPTVTCSIICVCPVTSARTTGPLTQVTRAIPFTTIVPFDAFA